MKSNTWDSICNSCDVFEQMVVLMTTTYDYEAEAAAVDLLVMFTFPLLDIPAGSRGVWDNCFHLEDKMG